MNNKETLAYYGGKIRSKPMPSRLSLGYNERREINKVLNL